MENEPVTIGALFKDAGDHLKTRLDLLKLQAIDRSSGVASSVVSGLIIVLIGFFALSILNIGLSFWIGEMLGKPYLGFFAVAGFYILLALLIYVFRNNWIKAPLSNKLIKKLLN